jgi:glycosyltransferase involved in cell wall biosynthesis
MRVMVTTVPPKAKGGIVALHQALFDAPQQGRLSFVFFPFASAAPFTENLASRLVRIVIDSARFVARLLREPALRIVHVNTAPDPRALLRDSWLVILCALTRRKVVLQIHGAVNMAACPGVVRWLAARAFALCGRILVFSRKDADLVAALAPGVPVQTFPNAIRTADFAAGDPSLAKDEPRSAAGKTVLCLCRMIRQKGVFDLLEAVPDILKECEDTTFVLAGDGPVLAELREAARRKGLEKSVRLPGHLSYADVRKALGAADVFALPTYYMEGMPTAILQAMAAGLPVVASPAGGIAEVVKDGVHGFIVPPRNPSILAGRILLLLKNDALRNRIAKANAEFARREFDVAVVLEKIEMLYASL